MKRKRTQTPPRPRMERKPKTTEKLVALAIQELREIRSTLHLGVAPTFFETSSGAFFPLGAIVEARDTLQAIAPDATFEPGAELEVTFSVGGSPPTRKLFRGEDADALRRFLRTRTLAFPEAPTPIPAEALETEEEAETPDGGEGTE